MYNLRLLLVTFLLTLLPGLPLTNAACYAPDGSLEPNTAYQPCIAVEGIHSMCCALNRTLVGGPADKCAQNGLCIGGSDGSIWRGFCTDKNWSSPGCLENNICSDTTGGTSSNSNQLTKCEDGSYCCGGNTSCCTENTGFTLNPTLISIKTASVSSSSSLSATATPTVSSPPSATETPLQCTPASSSEETLKQLAVNKGANATLVGVGVGVPLAVLAVVGSMLGFWLGQKRGRRTHSALANPVEKEGEGDIGDYKPYGEVVAGFGDRHDRVQGYEQKVPELAPVELGLGRR